MKTIFSKIVTGDKNTGGKRNFLVFFKKKLTYGVLVVIIKISLFKGSIVMQFKKKYERVTSF